MYILEAKDLRDVILMVPMAGVDIAVTTTDEEGEVTELFKLGMGHGRHELRDLIKYVPLDAEVSFEGATPLFRDGTRVVAQSLHPVLTTAANPSFKPTRMTDEMVRMRNDINKLNRKLARADDQRAIERGGQAEERESEREAEREALIEEEAEKERQAALRAEKDAKEADDTKRAEA